MAWRACSAPAQSRALTDMARAAVSKELVPQWLPNMPPAARARLPATKREGAVGVYFTACVNRIFGRTASRERRLSLQEAMVAVSARAGSPLWIPDDIVGHCCATIWHSKGYGKGNAVMANRVAEAMWRWSDGGRLPIVCDASSCSLGLTSEIVESSDAAEPRAPRQAHGLRLYRLGARPPACRSSPFGGRSPRRCCTRAVRPITSS